jgi:tRNA(adenine34) deaminase
MSPEEIMQVAIAEAQKSGTPYGAAIVKDNKIVETGFNTVEPDQDPTAHAEINVIRKLVSRLGGAETLSALQGYTLYTTCEPCPMCAATCIWAGLSEIVYGVGNDDFDGDHPNKIDLRCQEIIARSPNFITVRGGVLKDACKALHAN